MMRYRLSVTRAQGRWTVAGIVIVVALLATTAHSQGLDVDVDLPREGAVGETFTIEGSMPATCKPGTGEIGFDPDDLDGWEGEDPRSGNEIVVATPEVPGAFSETFQVPPISSNISFSFPENELRRPEVTRM